MAEEWARHPCVRAALEQTVGVHALGDMISALRDERGARMQEHARELFGRWCTLAEDAPRA